MKRYRKEELKGVMEPNVRLDIDVTWRPNECTSTSSPVRRWTRRSGSGATATAFLHVLVLLAAVCCADPWHVLLPAVTAAPTSTSTSTPLPAMPLHNTGQHRRIEEVPPTMPRRPVLTMLTDRIRLARRRRQMMRDVVEAYLAVVPRQRAAPRGYWETSQAFDRLLAAIEDASLRARLLALSEEQRAELMQKLAEHLGSSGNLANLDQAVIIEGLVTSLSAVMENMCCTFG